LKIPQKSSRSTEFSVVAGCKLWYENYLLTDAELPCVQKGCFVVGYYSKSL
jgi:hypothetical protein